MINYGSKPRCDFIKAIQKASDKLGAARDLFEIIDQLLIDAGYTPLLIENKANVKAQFIKIWQAIQEIKITLAEDKHGRIRR